MALGVVTKCEECSCHDAAFCVLSQCKHLRAVQVGERGQNWQPIHAIKLHSKLSHPQYQLCVREPIEPVHSVDGISLLYEGANEDEFNGSRTMW